MVCFNFFRGKFIEALWSLDAVLLPDDVRSEETRVQSSWEIRGNKRIYKITNIKNINIYI